ncbi:hypothetical protein O181_030441 [Austropuccinia psidii MF-1]|uniref:Uncharacterized protein n=1 Tax=Austropuccinia psidii MF-1 TaxID=1389203 RepID=A0A9Q3CT01_9BASI|nr:hypothetical protein [Austropuccinia psidii MF-1]
MAQKGHLGPRPPNEKGWPKDDVHGQGAQNSLGDKRTPPGPKTRIETWGLEIWKLAREANDGRIWPEAIKGQGKVIWPKGHGKPMGANWP